MNILFYIPILCWYFANTWIYTAVLWHTYCVIWAQVWRGIGGR